MINSRKYCDTIAPLRGVFGLRAKPRLAEKQKRDKLHGDLFGDDITAIKLFRSAG